MLDGAVRRRIDPWLDRLARRLVQAGVTADGLSLAGFALGLACAAAIAARQDAAALLLLGVSRLADGLDGAVARAGRGGTARGAFLDIVLDFAFYGAVPLAFALRDPGPNGLPACALLFAFYVNGASFLALAALAAKQGLSTQERGPKGFYFTAGLAEGTETILVLAAMAAWPAAFPPLALAFAALCLITAAARVALAVRLLSKPLRRVGACSRLPASGLRNQSHMNAMTPAQSGEQTRPATRAGQPSGTLPSQAIEALVAAGAVTVTTPLLPGQIQPASLDLRLGARVFRVRASFLPGAARSVAERLEDLALHEIDLSRGAVLETGCVYVAELQEGLGLPPGLRAAANPKSSTGRLDVFTRVIADRARSFDVIEAGYHGPLHAEISPRSFPVLVREGSRLSQLRFRQGEARLDDAAHRALHAQERLVAAAEPSIADGVAVSVDLTGLGVERLVGFRAKSYSGLVDVDRVGAYEWADFWEPLHARGGAGRGALVLDPGQFYILASKEAVRVPPDFAAEMTPFDPLVGEFRVHYAGFFDPGFGHAAAGGEGARAVLEVRSRDVPFILEDGQTVGRLVYERMLERPAALYGASLASNYQAQGLKLSKHFR